MSDYPLHDEMKEREKERDGMQDFYDWLGANGFYICEYDDNDQLWPTRKSPEELIGGAMGIDPAALEKEKQKMLDDIRKLYG